MWAATAAAAAAVAATRQPAPVPTNVHPAVGTLTTTHGSCLGWFGVILSWARAEGFALSRFAAERERWRVAVVAAAAAAAEGMARQKGFEDRQWRR